MEVGFLGLLIYLYKIFAFLVLGIIAVGSCVAPLFLCDEAESCAPAFLWIFAPLIIAVCLKLMNLL